MQPAMAIWVHYANAAMGEALGFAAALAKRANTDFASMDGREVAHYMKKQGYLL